MNYKGIKHSIIILFLVAFFPFILTSCANTLYIGKLAWGEAKILGEAVENDEALRDKGVDEKIKDGIRLVQEVKEFAQQRWGLRLNGSYETFYRVKGDALLYLVSACPKDSLEPHTWRYPFVGKMDYRGFFNRADAVKEINELEEQGLDICLQQAVAFSTLGWLNDPLYSTVLHLHPVIVINIVIHELVHNTVFFKGETEFNEQVASFIAEKGSLMFIEEHFGRPSPFYQYALDLESDERLMAGFFQELYDKLRMLYDQELPREEKLRLREDIFVHGRERLTELGKFLKTEGSNSPGGLNNAVVLAYRRYLPTSEGLLQQAYKASGGDIKGFLELLRTIQKSKKPPYRFLESWLQKRLTSSSN
jgi:predicted aminopeptidase